MRHRLTVVQGKWTISVSWLAVARKETLDNGQAIETTPFVPTILSAPWMAIQKLATQARSSRNSMLDTKVPHNHASTAGNAEDHTIGHTPT